MNEHLKRQLDFMEYEESKMSKHIRTVFKEIQNLCKAKHREIKIDEIINEQPTTYR